MRSSIGAYSPSYILRRRVVDPIYHSTISRWTGEAESLVCCMCASLGGVATRGVGLDRITKRRWLVRLHHLCSIECFRCVISSRVWRSYLSVSLITSLRLDLGFLVCTHRIFLIYSAVKPFSSIRARSMRRWVSRVEHNMLIVGVDVFCCKPLFCVLLMAWHSEIEVVQANLTRPCLRDRLRTWRITCSTHAASGYQFLSL
jgi:hypothetical protein